MTKDSFQGVKLENNNTTFSLYSPEAKKVELCLFDESETTETKIPMQKDENGVWHTSLEGNLEGTKYGYRASGEYDPKKSLYFNPNKLLVDPYAIEVTKSLHNLTNNEKEALYFDNNIDSKDIAPKGVVRFLNKETLAKKYPYLYKKANTPWEKTHIYELHVGNFSKKHPDIDPQNRGKILALKDTINYFKALSYNQIELMPITPTMSDWQLDVQKGLSDQWGYNPINHHAIDPRYGSIFDLLEVINSFHQNGLEVCLDVVYNHTGEFGKKGFTLSYKGLDAKSYYRFSNDKDKSFINTTGCGNGFNPNTPQGAKIIRDSLMFFADICGVDAFRFDLAGDCCLDNNLQFDPNCNFLKIVDEVAKKTGAKMSGEPWSAVGGYFLGQIPNIYEWNDKHEKSLKMFIRGEYGQINSLAHYLAGGGCNNKVNIFTKHDGATGYDWATYSTKNNYENNENNNDGSNENHYSPSANNEERLTKTKSAHALNTLARGVPLSLSGDELWRSQNGNNNGYAKSFPLLWEGFTKEQQERYLFERKVNAFRLEHPIFSSVETVNQDIMPNNKPSWEWVNVHGDQMRTEDWDFPQNRFLGYVLNGEDKDGVRYDDDFFVMMSGCPDNQIEVTLPKTPHIGNWEVVFDTSKPTTNKNNEIYNDGDKYMINPQSVVVFTNKRKKDERQNTNQMLDIIKNKTR